VESERWWGASLTAGWESRHIHYGIDETGDYGAYTTELSVWVHDFLFSVWSGFGTGNDYEEWNFTAAYNLELGPVFFMPGYNFRYTPGLVNHSEDDHEEHGHEEDHEGHDHEEEEHDHEEEEHGHFHQTYGNELFFVLGTTAVPYVTPNVAFIWDLNNTPGAFLEFRLDGDIPLYADVLSLQPYALLGINLGYNTRDNYGWNNFQFGMEATWKVNRTVSVFAGINYSVAMTVLQDLGQSNEVWANAGVTLRY
jgi:hypothetical protein